MALNDAPTDLTGQMLIAMPGMGDPRFEKSVVFLCAHSDDGAMGLIVNKPAKDLRLADLLKQLEIEIEDEPDDVAVYYGGPMENGRGFVIHSDEYQSRLSTLALDAGLAMTGTLDILEDIAVGRGPVRQLLALGYAGWGPGQLEGEIAQNAWLTCPASSDLVFGTTDRDKWGAALGSLGVDALSLSAHSGRA